MGGGGAQQRCGMQEGLPRGINSDGIEVRGLLARAHQRQQSTRLVEGMAAEEVDGGGIQRRRARVALMRLCSYREQECHIQTNTRSASEGRKRARNEGLAGSWRTWGAA